MTTEPIAQTASASSRAGVRRTVWILVACAVGSYALFLISVLHGK